MNKGKRILNLDQSIINQCNASLKGWMPNDLVLSNKLNAVHPGISMMAAIDS